MLFRSNYKVAAQVLINDVIYFTGYLKLNRVSVQNGKQEYDVSLFSEAATLFGDIGNNLLKSLNYADEEYTFNHEFSFGTVTSGFTNHMWSNDGEKPPTYFYPVVHNGYLYSGETVNFTGGTALEQTSLYTSTAPIGSFSSVTGLTGYKPYRINSPFQGPMINQLKPAMSVWSMIKLIFKTYGYEVKSDFFNTPWFKGLYTYGMFSASSTKFGYSLQTIYTYPTSGVEVVAYPTEDLQNVDLIIAQRGTGTPCYCSNDIDVTIKVIRKYHGFLGIAAYQNEYYTYTIANGTSGTTVNINQTQPSSTIWRHFDSVTQTNPNVPVVDKSALKYYPVAVNESVPYLNGDYVDFSLVIDPTIKQIDFLSSIFKKFNLIIVTDLAKPNSFIIEQIGRAHV